MPLILRRSGTQYVTMGVNKIVKVIPQYCSAHPVLRIITWLGRRAGNLWQGRERKLSESVEIIVSAKTHLSRSANSR